MRRLILFLPVFATLGALQASYFFECEATVRLTAVRDNKVSYVVESVKECATHLQVGEKKTSEIKAPAATPGMLQKGRKYRVRYHYMAPECLEKDGTPIDCHREVIEILP